MKQLLPVWLFAFAVIFGSAYNLYLYYDDSNNPDCYTYLSIANGNFKDQSLTRRYRILVPFAAKIVSLPVEKVYAKIWTNRSGNDLSLRLAFLMVNVCLMAFSGVAVYALCKAYSISETGSFLAMIAVLCGGRWGSLFAAIPNTDSLYLLILTLVVLALKTNNDRLLAFSIVVGPLAKESFIFVAPLIFFFAEMPKWKQLLWFALAGIIAFGIRFYIDRITGTAMLASIANDTGHTENITYSLRRIFSLHGIGEIASVLGIFSFIIVAGFTKGKAAVKSWTSHIDGVLWWLIPIMFVHALLSSEVARMCYLFCPFWAVCIGLIWDKHPLFRFAKTIAIPRPAN